VQTPFQKSGGNLVQLITVMHAILNDYHIYKQRYQHRTPINLKMYMSNITMVRS